MGMQDNWAAIEPRYGGRLGTSAVRNVSEGNLQGESLRISCEESGGTIMLHGCHFHNPARFDEIQSERVVGTMRFCQAIYAL